jgi:hypothetical protein
MPRHVTPRGREQYAREVASLTRLRGAILIDENCTQEQSQRIAGYIDRLVEEIRDLMNLAP